MKIKALPKEVVAELLHFLADTESFQETIQVLGESVEIADLRRALREVGSALRQEAQEEAQAVRTTSSQNNKHLSPKAREILTCLTPREERIISKTFGLNDL
ncbi:MAG: hypothetical protein Q7S00_03370 [bacterium]|nr:hypothetical protein [bacterium]